MQCIGGLYRDITLVPRDVICLSSVHFFKRVLPWEKPCFNSLVLQINHVYVHLIGGLEPPHRQKLCQCHTKTNFIWAWLRKAFSLLAFFSWQTTSLPLRLGRIAKLVASPDLIYHVCGSYMAIFPSPFHQTISPESLLHWHRDKILWQFAVGTRQFCWPMIWP